MQTPLQISFRDVDRSDAVEANIRERAEKLEQFYPNITGCTVIAEKSHAHHHKGNLYHIRIDLMVPGAKIVVGRDPGANHAHEDIYVAVRDAFNAARRQLEDRARRLRGNVKSHVTPPMGEVIKLFADDEYGFIKTTDGDEVYFHRNSVDGNGFDHMEIGQKVRLTITQGDKGPQASAVHLAGR